MTKDEALMLALEALENLQRAYREAVKLWDPNHHDAYTVNSHNAVAVARETLAQPEQSQVEETLRYEIDALEAKLAECRAQQQEPVCGATLAGMHATIRHLSALVDEQRKLMVEVDDVFGRDEHGLKFEDGDSELIDRVRTHIEAISEPKNQEPEPVIDKSAAVRIATSLGWEPKREPLSEERIDDIWNLHCDEMGYVSVSDAVEIARDFEAAHGIKENT